MRLLTFLIISFLISSQAIAEAEFSTYAMIVPREQATLSSQFTGEIQAVLVRDGESFQKGQLLIKFNCDVKEVELEKARAEVESTAIAKQSAEELDRLKSVSKVEVAKARIEHQRAMIEVKRLQTELKQCVITAPFDGKVIEILAHAHEDITPSEPLVKIINDRDLEVKLFVPSTWLIWMKTGTDFTIHLDELDQTVDARVTKINPQVDTASQTIDIYGKLISPPASLLSGMSGIASFQGP